MSYKLQFVQEFTENGRDEFLRLEKLFADLEKTEAGFYRGKRYVSFMGQLPCNTFIWECEFDTAEQAVQALITLKSNDSHEQLFDEQSKYFVRSYTNLYKSVCDE